MRERPAGAEVLNSSQLAAHARELGSRHQVLVRGGSNDLLARLGENERLIQAFNRATASISGNSRKVTPAAEWLFDNGYLIDEQVLMARRHLPRGYSRELPRLANGPSAGLPRVYDLVLEYIGHVDAQFEEESLSAFVSGYEATTPLKLGELWGIPIMLRLGLLENLRRVTERLMETRLSRDVADRWGDRLQSVLEAKVLDPIVVVAELSGATPPLSNAFVAEFSQRLARLGPAAQLARNWLEQRLAEESRSIDQVVLLESQEQASAQVSVSHGIASLRLLGTLDWRRFVEKHSLVDHVLRRDPAGVYERMDFATRDEYRHSVEEIAKDSRRLEVEVAELAVECAEDSVGRFGKDDRRAHVGFHLVDEGRAGLESKARTPWTIYLRPDRLIRRHPLAFYLGGIGIVTVAGTLYLAPFLHTAGLKGAPWILCLAALVLGLSQLGVSILNWLAPFLVAPRRLPRMDYSEGLAPECRTMVVIPTLLTERAGADRLLESLEIHHLANRDSRLHFALLTDFKDATTEETEEDAALIRRVRAGIDRLNRAHGATRFFLFHRPRRWNAQEGVWMGYERKRGKLGQFNALLRGRGRESFSEVVGDESVLPEIRFVITLDTDTQLPLDTARRLVGTIAHPLNRPRTDPATGIVTAGYGILQPRVGVSLPSAGRSWFVKLVTGDAGIDPYTRTVSDVYQDVFNEGSFIGKGIYDVDAFENAVEGRFPENTILSHDLIESVHARSALVSDVELYEEHPSRYNADIRRRHRWIRGDWQVAPWLFSRVPGAGGRSIPNPLSWLSRWKLFDNLRRSLVPASLMFLLLSVCFLAPLQAGLASIVVAGVVLLPVVLSFLSDVVRQPRDARPGLHVVSAFRRGGRQFAQAGLTLAFLPYDAWMSLDAVIRTLVRLLWTRRRLLEWQTASDAEGTARADLLGFVRAMWIAPTIGLVSLAALLSVGAGGAVLWMAPLALSWVLAPWLAWWISLPLDVSQPEFSHSQRTFLRRTARRTWLFFEELVTAQEHWLPPDNFQETPHPRTARRTSPTNMGVALLSTLAARDFGYLSVGRMMQRIGDSLGSMEGLERHRGHFLNWYSTETREPLLPRYVSTVDSGNLAGHLVTLSAGLLEMIDRPVYQPAIFDGLRDSLELAIEGRKRDETWQATFALLDAPPGTLAEAIVRLEQLLRMVGTLRDTLEPDSGEGPAWLDRFENECREHARELRVFTAPGEDLPSPKEGGEGTMPGAHRPNPTLREVASLEPAAPGPGSEHGGRAAAARALLHQLEGLARRCTRMAEMDFGFLFDTERKLFTIGYNVSDRRRDASFYDLLASEARLCSYFCVARGLVNQEHWFLLGRLLGEVDGEPVLMSWSGSMFEYLMPLLVMPTYDNTLLDRTYRSAVAAQVRYGRSLGIPWGISESGYQAIDVHGNYQYRAFGVPGLGFKRGLADDIVVAPYASMLALMVDPLGACENLQALAREGCVGRFGFYEAVDYTATRLPPGQTRVLIRSFMAHHQGMGLLALDNVLLGGPMPRRFLTHPWFKATELLLQERMPHSAARIGSETDDATDKEPFEPEASGVMRVYNTPQTPHPEVHLLSNGRYHVMISQAGSGYSRWGNLDITRWREDPTRDCWGTFAYIRDLNDGDFWSTGYHPVLRLGERYEAIFTQGRAEFRRRIGDLELHTEIAVSPEDDVELRRIRLTNHGSSTRTLEITTYAEVVLAPTAADAAHPAFSNLFVQTEYDCDREVVLCTRRPRTESEPTLYLFHLLNVGGGDQESLSFETDRGRFVGRGRTLSRPLAMDGALSGSTGAVLDPIVALRRVIRLEPDETVRMDHVAGVANDRAGALALADKYCQHRLTDRLLDLAWTHSQVTLRHLDCTEAEAQEFGRLAGALVQANPARRAASGILTAKHRGQSGLWSYGVSGDFPLVLVQIGDAEQIQLVQRAVQAHAYWRIKGLTSELVILIEDTSVYRQSLHDQIVGAISAGPGMPLLEKPGGIFVRRLEQLPPEDRTLFLAVARLVLSDEMGTFSEQVRATAVPTQRLPPLLPQHRHAVESGPALQREALQFDNGLGGFSADGSEYVMHLSGRIPQHGGAGPRPIPFSVWNPGRREASSRPTGAAWTDVRVTPAPWVNVLANAYFGTIVSESGSSYTWLENSHEFRLTPWHNDPVSDPSGEVFFLRDEETGEFWSPTPQPAPSPGAYAVRHGFGYTVFEHVWSGIATTLTITVAQDAPVKVATLRIRNHSGRTRRLSATGYWEWVLGESRARTAIHVQTRLDTPSGALLASNSFNSEFADRVAFVDVDDPDRTHTGDRGEFLGRNGTLASPAALKRVRLSGRTGAGMDPCAALQSTVELIAGEEREIVFRIGAGRSLAEVQYLIQRFRRAPVHGAVLEGTQAYWRNTLSAVQVRTPDAALNTLANGWLVYQTLSARLWGRTGFYQSGGAFGFRDQLQDAMALVHADPALLREHLLRAAARQFSDGDVQHWWHPPSGRGVRTHISDDLLWLPYAVCRYVRVTHDSTVLNESIPYLEGRAVRPDEEGYYDLPHHGDHAGSLYEHCVRAIDRGLRLGEHGLPLMGSGDWNDGFNLVGAGHRGESVWLGFFLIAVLKEFSAVALERNDTVVSSRCREQAAQLERNIEEHAWDGEWYQRAWFDDGTPLGSRASQECQIDSLPQSWAVLAGTRNSERQHTAMDSVMNRLVRKDGKLIQLFDPPFDRSDLNPGYIKGYVPGVRENGGQYTHAAIWTVMAMAELGDRARAWELFNMINPILHGSTPSAIATYKVEPYVIAADVYSVGPHLGRGGWTWYTGSAGWMYRLILESLLGVTREGDSLLLEPRVPDSWSEYEVHYRYGKAVYHLIFQRASAGDDGSLRLHADGQALPDNRVPLMDDALEHEVRISLPAVGAASATVSSTSSRQDVAVSERH
jgi:cellobiose phosphorylase